MTRVKCRRRDCVYWENGVCGRDLITVDEEEGCVNFEEMADLLDEDEDLDWDGEEEEEDLDFYDEDEEWEPEEDEEGDEEDEEGVPDPKTSDWDD